MIDLHCHILPGLDDGARGLQDSIAMAQQAEADGIVAVCATPHIRSDHAVPVDEVAALAGALDRELAARDIAVRILPGGEVAAAEAAALTDRQLRSVTLGGGGRWLLLEPAPGPLGSDLVDLVRGLAGRGFGAVVAHPERHAGADLEQQLRALAQAGCLIQWTAQFVADAAAGDLVLRLAAAGLVDLLASDAHSALAGRPVRISPAFERLRSVCSAERVAWMAEAAPRAIVRGEPVSPRPS